MRFVAELSNLGIKYRLMDLDGLDKLKESRVEEPCPFFLQPHHRRRRRKRSSNDEMEHHDDHEGIGMHCKN